MLIRRKQHETPGLNTTSTADICVHAVDILPCHHINGCG